MEGNMVNSFTNTNIKLIKDFFEKKLSDFQVISESSHGPYWNIKFFKGDVEIHISGDIGFAIEIFIDNTKFELWQYDKTVNEAMQTTVENIMYQLNILSDFLREK